MQLAEDSSTSFHLDVAASSQISVLLPNRSATFTSKGRQILRLNISAENFILHQFPVELSFQSRYEICLRLCMADVCSRFCRCMIVWPGLNAMFWDVGESCAAPLSSGAGAAVGDRAAARK